jgi:hypothetical protein
VVNGDLREFFQSHNLSMDIPKHLVLIVICRICSMSVFDFSFILLLLAELSRPSATATATTWLFVQKALGLWQNIGFYICSI